MIKFKHSYPYYYIIPPPVSSAKNCLVFSLNIFILCVAESRGENML